MTDEQIAEPRYVLVNPSLVEILRGPHYGTVKRATLEWWRDKLEQANRNYLENSRGTD